MDVSGASWLEQDASKIIEYGKHVNLIFFMFFLRITL